MVTSTVAAVVCVHQHGLTLHNESRSVQWISRNCGISATKYLKVPTSFLLSKKHGQLIYLMDGNKMAVEQNTKGLKQQTQKSQTG